MKKSFIALFIGSAFFLSACEESNIPQKVFEAEKKIVQLEADAQKNSKALINKETELSELKAEYATLKAQYDTLSTGESLFPSLQVNIETLFDKKEHLTYPKAAEDDEYSAQEGNVEVSLSVPKTNVMWLDQLLWAQAYQIFNGNPAPKNTTINRETLTVLAESSFQQLIKEATENKEIGLSQHLSAGYLGQRNNISSFSFMNSIYTGGAHGIYSTHYINVDTQKKTIIQLNDLVSKKNQPKLKELLWESYESQHLDENGKYNGFAEKKDFYISENFYFSNGNVIFVYPLYTLGPFVEGEVELSTYIPQELLNISD